MKFIVLSSGSKGNCTYVEYKNTKILIDLGNSCKYVVNKLKEIGVDAKDIDAILITHTHVDHVNGLRVFLKRFNTKVYLSKLMLDELDYVNNYSFIDMDGFSLMDMYIDVIKTSHDANDSVGYIVCGGEKRLVYITDTGYINEKYFPILSNADAYVMESNHDIEMLQNSRYPFHLRQRIMGDKGHISNYDCSRYLASFLGNNTKCIILAHLSLENNTPDKAINTLRDRFDEEDILFDRIIVSKQDEETEMVEV